MAVDTKRDQELVSHYIEVDPFRGRANARVKDRGVRVWAIIAYLKGTNWDVSDAMRAYHLTPEMLEAAEAFYRLNRKYVDAKLLLNSDDAD